MRFKKTKMPRPLHINGHKEPIAYVTATGTALVNTGWPSPMTMGPRGAARVARWLDRYTKWSSVKDAVAK